MEEIISKLEEQDKRLTEIEKKIDATFKSSEKMRKYFLWTLIISFVVIVLPSIGLIFAIPAFLSSYNFGALGL